MHGLAYFLAAVIAAVVGLVAIRVATTLRRQRYNAAVAARKPSLARSERELFALAVGALTSEADLTTLTTGVSRPRALVTLSQAWGVTSTKTALEMLDWLLGEGHRAYFEGVVSIYRADRSRWNKAAYAVFEDGKKGLEYVNHFAEALPTLETAGIVRNGADLDRGAIAWDMARGISMARLAYDAGFLRESDAWQIVIAAADMVRRRLSSWDELARSYVLGSAMWSGPSDELSGASSTRSKACSLERTRRGRINRGLLTQPRGLRRVRLPRVPVAAVCCWQVRRRPWRRSAARASGGCARRRQKRTASRATRETPCR